jgi:ABC-2 type transport system permease protein
MRNVLLVVKHEILAMLGKRSFWLMTFLFPALIIGLSAGSQFLAERSFEQSEADPTAGQAGGIGYVDQAGLIQQLPQDLPASVLRAFPDEAAARAALEAGDLSQYYVIPADFVESGQVVLVDDAFTPFGSLVGGSVDLVRYVVDYNLIQDERLTSLLSDPTPSVTGERMAPVEGSTETSNLSGAMSFWIPYATMFIFFFVITMSGGFMLQSVSKEKENRIVEVLLVSLRPRELMLGKVVGLGVVALVQMGLWMGAGMTMLNERSGLLDMATTFEFPPGFFVWAALYFLLGYLLYASALGALGALAPSAREGAQFTFIVILPLLIPIWLNSVFMQSPNGTLATILSLFPLTAPTSMVTRLVSGGVPIWQPFVGLLGLAVTAYLFVLLAARFFRADTLLSDASLDWRRIVEAFRK